MGLHGKWSLAFAGGLRLQPRRGAETAPVGAIVIGGDYQGLGIVRSLGRAGVQTCVVDDERSIARHSRYVTHALRVRSLRSEEETLAALELARRMSDLDGWVVFPTRDESVAAIARNREQLSKRFAIPTPPWETVRFACDKRNTYGLAAKLGLSAPRTWSGAGGLPADLAYPIVLKPAIKEHFLYATKAKAWRADNESELNALLASARRILPADEILLQELIPGDGSHQFAYCAFFRDGRSVADMTVRRSRQHPSQFGRSSTFVETIDIAEIIEPSQRFLRAIDYYGLVEIEYKRDARDGSYKLLDVNVRTWGYHSIGPRAGVDFVKLLYLDQVGRSTEPCRATPGIAWVRLTTDVPAALLELVHRRVTVGEYLASLRRVRTEAVFSIDDPSPGLAELVLVPYLAVKRGY
jgi:D-aspartate ligase